MYQDTNPDGPNYLSRHRALVGSHCMVNRLSPTLAKVISVSTSYQNLVNTNLDDCVTMTNAAKVDVGVEPFITVRDMAHYYAAGTTAGFVVQVDAKKVLGLQLGGFPFKIFFYYKGKLQESVSCQQKKGTVLALDLIHVSGDNATVELTAKSTKPFDEIGICAEGVATVDVLGSTSLYYAFVGKNGKYYLTSSGSNHDSDSDTSSNGINAYKAATKEYNTSNITLGEWPSNLTAMINNDTKDCNTIAVSGNLSVYAMAKDGTMPFKAGMKAGFEIGEFKLISALSAKAIKLYKIKSINSLGKWDYEDVSPKSNVDFQVLGVNLGFGRQNMSITATSDFNAIGIDLVGLNVGGINAYRAFVELPPEVIDDDEPLVISADRSLCDEKQQVTLHSDVPVKWSCEDTHGSTLTYSPEDYATECTVSGITHAGTYVFTATAEDGRTTATTKVTNGISREYNLGMKPWVNNFTETDEKGHLIHYTSDMTEYKNKYKIFSADLLPLGGTKNTANIVTPSLDDYATYIGGLQLGNDRMIAGVYRDHPFTITEPTIVGFVVRPRWKGIDVGLLNGLEVKVYNAGKDITADNTVTANNNFKVLSATVIGGESSANTEYTLEIDASKSNPVTFDAITFWDKGLLALNISGIDIIDAFTETAADATDYQKRLDESGEMVSHYTTGARIDESLMNGGSAVDVAQTCNNLTNIIDGQVDTYMDYVAPVSVASFVPIPIKLGRRYDAGHQITLIYSTDKSLNVKVGKAINIVTYLNGSDEPQETKANFDIVKADVIGGSDKSEIVWTPTKDFDEISIHLAGVADVVGNLRIYGIRIENDADYDGIPDNEDDQSCDNQFLIDENETTLVKDHDYVNGCMNLRRYMSLKEDKSKEDENKSYIPQWFNICLPVNMSFNQFVSTFGNDAELAKPDDFVVGQAKYLHFSIPYVYGDNTLLEAGVPYIIKVTDMSNLTDQVKNAISSEMNTNDASALKKVYKVQGVDFLMDGPWKNGTTTITCTQPTENVGKAGNVQWFCGYCKNQTVIEGSYIFYNGELRRLGYAPKVLGLRSWMHEVEDKGGAKFSGLNINGTLFSDGATTGIHQINADKSDNRMYNLQGMRVDHENGQLPAGIYIINGKKVIIK